MGVAISLYGFHVHITQVSLSFSDVRKWVRKQPVKKLKASDIIYFSSILRLLSAVYKSGTRTRGRGQRDSCVGTWDLGTRGEGRGDIWYGARDVWDAGTCGTGTRGRQM